MSFVSKLDAFLKLAPEECELLSATVEDAIEVEADVELVGQSEPYRYAYVIASGWVIRARLLPDGSRQILNFLLPGDAAGLAGAMFNRADHDVVTLTRATVARLNPERVLALMAARPRVGAALFWSVALEESALRERIVGLGRRSAEERMAHLFVELIERQRSGGRDDDGVYVLPLTQTHVADAMGLSLVHVNRVMRSLAQRGLIRIRPGRLSIVDEPGLRRISDFDGAFLHRDGNAAAAIDGKRRVAV